MACALAHLLLAVVLTETSATLARSGRERQASPCPSRWILFGQRCFTFYPVWSSWTAAHSICSQTGGNLASIHTPEERQFVRQIANTHTPVWLGGHQAQQNGTWFWSDNSPFKIGDWTNQRQGKATEGGACMAITAKSGELHSAPCGELRFYICSTRASENVPQNHSKPVGPGIFPTESLFDVVWGYSDALAEEILHSSSFLRDLQTGRLTQRRYADFLQQEALYLHGVSSTLEVLIGGLQEAGGADVRSLLAFTLKHYSSRNQSLLTSPPPQWLRSSLQSFHSVVLEDPVYWLVALSARACLRHFLARELSSSGTGPCSQLGSGSEVEACSRYQEWNQDTQTEVTWTRRYKKVLDQRQQHMDVFQTINIFREHMINQKSFYKAIQNLHPGSTESAASL